jgi:tetratricopeptide (TPR) repeat protein
LALTSHGNIFRKVVVLSFCLAAAAGQDSELREALTRHQAGDVAGAIPLYEKYLKQFPNSLDAIANYGAALSHEGRYGDAIVQYEKALRIQPANPRIRINLGLALYKGGRFAEAAVIFEKVLPEVASIPDAGHQVTLLLASCDLNLGKNREAIAILQPLESNAQDDKGLAYLLGMAMIRDGQTDAGARMIDRILRGGDSAEAHLMLGEAKLNALDYTSAKEEFEKAAGMNPTLAEAYSMLGQALVGLNQADAAGAAFRKAAELDPNNFAAVFQMAILARQDNRLEEARKLLARSLSLRPGDAAVRYQIAVVDLAAGRTEESRGELEKIVAEAPDFSEAHVALASAYYKLKRKEDGDREREVVRKLAAVAQEKQSKRDK